MRRPVNVVNERIEKVCDGILGAADCLSRPQQVTILAATGLLIRTSVFRLPPEFGVLLELEVARATTSRHKLQERGRFGLKALLVTIFLTAVFFAGYR